ncbi:MAG: DNA (cytosine-5-)-methyltransferase, partial [Anaerolineales bacterium]|nr:DNA (cytosine-5-)-methyltransferase [Anaerolineales bacterium]
MLTVHEAAQQLQLSPDTIRRWEKKGLIRAQRSKQNHRLFDLDELQRVQAKYLGDDRSDEVPWRILKAPTTPYRVIELFAGAGGMAVGFENAGLNDELLVELNSDATDTLRLNRPEWQVVTADVAEIDFTPYADQIDIVSGGFPCQAFSYAGLKRGFEDTRGTLFFEFARCVKEVRPKIALGENVRGLLRHDNGRTLQTIVAVLEELGYRVEYRLLKAQFHDVPQKRERLIIVGVREDLDIPHIFPEEQDYFITLRAALADCPDSLGSSYPPKKHEVLAMVPPGGYWRDLPLEVQKSYMGKSFFAGGGKTGMARRLSWDEPSLTLTCSPAQKQTERCHPEETRPLTIREYARVQTFPDEWEFSGSVASQYRQIGNAVPVNLAYHIGRALVTMLDIAEKQKRIGEID